MFLSENILMPIRLLFRKDRESYFVLHRILGFYPRKIKYYNLALMHKSMHMRTDEGKLVNNERLEFLGDAILGAVVGDVVYHHFEGKREGFLTNTRSKIVQRETLNRVAVEIGLDKLIQCSTPTHSHNSYMCGNAFEAFIGAIYLDRGYAYCDRFIRKRILCRLIDLDKVARQEQNFKSKIIEWCQKKHINIRFELVAQHHIRCEAYSPVFETRLLLEGIVCGEGTGYSKKESQQKAARMALKRIKNDKELMAQVMEAKALRESPVVVEEESVQSDATEPQPEELLVEQPMETPAGIPEEQPAEILTEASST